MPLRPGCASSTPVGIGEQNEHHPFDDASHARLNTPAQTSRGRSLGHTRVPQWVRLVAKRAVPAALVGQLGSTRRSSTVGKVRRQPCTSFGPRRDDRQPATASSCSVAKPVGR